MTDEKPLHVRVAEAIGWTEIVVTAPFLPDGPTHWLGRPPAGDPEQHQYVSAIDHVHRVLTVNAGSIPRYDEDWAAVGPLIERYGLCLVRGRDGGWWAFRGRSRGVWEVVVEADVDDIAPEHGDTICLAVCTLIVVLHAAEKLQVRVAGA